MSLLFASETVTTAPTAEGVVTLGHWLAFGLFVVVMLALDLLVFHRKSHEPSLRESLGWTIFWCLLALSFNGLIWWWLGRAAAGAFLLGYVVEWSLSMDNVFVFLVVFNYFGVPLKYQYRVLFWGILGAVVMRLTFVAVAAVLIAQFAWVMWIFGLFLIYTGVKLAIHDDKEVHPEKNIVLRLAKKLFPVSPVPDGDRFFVRREGVMMATPLFLVLLVIESTDVLFAIDSVPAIFGAVSGFLATSDPAFTFIVFTSNVFAILGLRALYFLLAGVIGMFRFLSYGLAGVLMFVGLKMVVNYFAEWLLQWHHAISPQVSLLVIFGLLGGSIGASLIADAHDKGQTSLASGEVTEEPAEENISDEPSPDSQNS